LTAARAALENRLKGKSAAAWQDRPRARAQAAEPSRENRIGRTTPRQADQLSQTIPWIRRTTLGRLLVLMMQSRLEQSTSCYLALLLPDIV